MNIGENIHIARKNAELSQNQLAKLCGINPSSVSFFETGRGTPIARIIVKLAEAMNVSTDELLGRRDISIRLVPCAECRGTGRVLNAKSPTQEAAE